MGIDDVRVMKAAAKSGEAWGTVRTTAVRLELFDPLSHRVVTGDGLVEIELRKGMSVLCGDSGALICAERDDRLHPLALLVAGASVGKLRDFNSPDRAVLYGLPLSMIPAIARMRIA
jgi:hypothetical protein